MIGQNKITKINKNRILSGHSHRWKSHRCTFAPWWLSRPQETVLVEHLVCAECYHQIHAKTIRWPTAGWMLRRWPNIQPAVGQSLVVAGIGLRATFFRSTSNPLSVISNVTVPRGLEWLFRQLENKISNGHWKSLRSTRGLCRSRILRGAGFLIELIYYYFHF